MNLGRFQPGQIARIGTLTTGSDGLLVTPDAAPVATIRDSNGAEIDSFKIPMAGGTRSFYMNLFLGITYPLGTYTVGYAWGVGAFSGTASDTFTVIRGGDVGGRIISMYAYVRPEAQYVVAQLSSGNIVQGRNPRL